MSLTLCRGGCWCVANVIYRGLYSSRGIVIFLRSLWHEGDVGYVTPSPIPLGMLFSFFLSEWADVHDTVVIFARALSPRQCRLVLRSSLSLRVLCIRLHDGSALGDRWSGDSFSEKDVSINGRGSAWLRRNISVSPSPSSLDHQGPSSASATNTATPHQHQDKPLIDYLLSLLLLLLPFALLVSQTPFRVTDSSVRQCQNKRDQAPAVGSPLNAINAVKVLSFGLRMAFPSTNVVPMASPSPHQLHGKNSWQRYQKRPELIGIPRHLFLCLLS